MLCFSVTKPGYVLIITEHKARMLNMIDFQHFEPITFAEGVVLR